jgi:MFS family permease
VLPATVLLGLGMGLAMPALMTLSMSVASPSDAGLASGLVNTTVQVGGAIGLAVLATLASERSGGAHTAEALNAGYHLAFVIGAILTGAAVLVAIFVLREPREPRAHATPEPAYS